MSPRMIAISPTPPERSIKYSIATLVTDRAMYADMVTSFAAKGFGGEDCEFLYLDNTEANRLSAFRGLNRLLDEARGEHVILCHQDVRLLSDDRAALDRRLADLEHRDAAWAVAGNAGGVGPGRLAVRISDPHGENQRVGNLPERVASLDENFIVVRRSARLALSDDLEGFHFYGTDLCLQAELRGHTAYVIDFHLRHLSGGNTDTRFWEAANRFRDKYAKALRPRFVQTTCALLYLSGQPLLHRLVGALARPIARIARRLPAAQGWTSPGQRQVQAATEAP